MDDENVNPAPEPRVPTVEDLLLLCIKASALGNWYSFLLFTSGS